MGSVTDLVEPGYLSWLMVLQLIVSWNVEDKIQNSKLTPRGTN